MSGRGRRGGRGSGSGGAPLRRGDWAVGRPRRVDADERIRDVRTIFNAPNVDVAPRAADVGDGRLSLRRPDGRDARRGALDFLPEALDSGTG